MRARVVYAAALAAAAGLAVRPAWAAEAAGAGTELEARVAGSSTSPAGPAGTLIGLVRLLSEAMATGLLSTPSAPEPTETICAGVFQIDPYATHQVWQAQHEQTLTNAMALMVGSSAGVCDVRVSGEPLYSTGSSGPDIIWVSGGGAVSGTTVDSNAGAATCGEEDDTGTASSDPVDLATGEYYLVQTDLAIPGRGLGITFARTYRSMTGIWSAFGGGTRFNPDLVEDQPLGMNWDHSLNIRVEWSPPASNPGGLPALVRLMMGDGRRLDWIYDEDLTDARTQVAGQAPVAVFSRPGTPAVLECAVDPQTGELTFEYVIASGVRYTFGAPRYRGNEFVARVAQITDRNWTAGPGPLGTGNIVTFEYDEARDVVPGAPVGDDREVLVRVSDRDGRGIDFRYVRSGPHNLLTEAEDHTGRVVAYTHASVTDWDPSSTSETPKALLTEVTLPAVADTGTSGAWDLPDGHARFPAGRSWTFDYHVTGDLSAGTALDEFWSTGRNDAGQFWWGSQVHRVVDPNGDAEAVNTYHRASATADADRPESYRVVEQEHPGGRYHYTLTDADANEIDFVRLNRGDGTPQFGGFSVWVNNRRGSVKRFDYLTTGVAERSNQRRLAARVDYMGLAAADDQPTVPASVARFPATIGSGGASWAQNGPTLDDGSGYAAGTAIVTPYTDAAGNEAAYTLQGGRQRSGRPTGEAITRTFSDDPDPRLGGAVSSITISNPSGGPSITEEWRHDLALTIGGCACDGTDLPTAHRDAAGNVTIWDYDARGNLEAVYRGMTSQASILGPNPSLPSTSTAVAVEEYVHNAYGQVTHHTKPQHGPQSTDRATDRYVYYPDNAPGFKAGRLHQVIVDDGGLELTTTYDYDAAGNVTKMTEPDGDFVTRVYNQANQLVRERHWAAGQTPTADGSGSLAGRDLYYDAAGRLVREDVLNLDGSLQPGTVTMVAGGTATTASNPVITTVHSYDELGFLTATAREVGAFNGTLQDAGDGRYVVPSGPEWANTTYGLDQNQNVVWIFSSSDKPGQGDSGTRMAYDSRDRLVLRVDGAASTSDTTGLLVTYYGRDEAGRVEEVTVAPDDPNLARTTLVFHDEIGRAWSQQDPVGTNTYTFYDSAGRPWQTVVAGDTGRDDAVALPTGEEHLLSVTETEYDTLNRPVVRGEAIFEVGLLTTADLQGLTAADFAWTTTTYYPNSAVASVDAPGYVGATASLYDGAGRVVRTTDPAGNEVEYEYEPGGTDLLAVTMREVEGANVRAYRTEYAHDGLGRTIETIEGAYLTGGGPENTTTYTHDSRGNLLRQTDGEGNATQHRYDGLGRRTVTTVLGVAGATGGSIDTFTELDDLGRTVALTDDAGNTTAYAHDRLGRETTRTMANGIEVYTTEYDAAGNARRLVTARGIETIATHDAAGRLISRTVTGDLPVAEGGTALETYRHDGLGRMTLAENDHAKVTRAYESRGHILREMQNADAANGFPTASDRVVECGPDAAGLDALCVYPSGRRILRVHDAAGRLSGLYHPLAADPDAPDLANHIAEYEWAGSSRLLTRLSGNGVLASYSYGGYSGWTPTDPTDKSFMRPTSVHHSLAGLGDIDAREFSWDAAGNRTRHEDARLAFAAREARTFGYDAANRLVSTSFAFPGGLGTASTTTYALDGDHNRTSVASTETGIGKIGLAGVWVGTAYGSTAEDLALNRPSGDPGRIYTYDADGNTVRMSTGSVDHNQDGSADVFDLLDFLGAFRNKTPDADFDRDGDIDVYDLLGFLGAYRVSGGDTDEFKYDYRNRLVSSRHLDGVTVLTSAQYRYDALGRKVTESVTGHDENGAGLGTATRHLVWGGAARWQLLEEYDGVTAGAALLAAHAYGPGIDEALVTWRDRDADGQVDDGLWLHADDMGSVFAATDDAGAVLERYRYGDYGLPTVLEADGFTELPASTVGNRWMFTGREWMAHAGLYDYRNRVMDPRQGRFLQRDPLGYVDAMNLYAFVISNPLTKTDPYGLSCNACLMVCGAIIGAGGGLSALGCLQFGHPAAVGACLAIVAAGSVIGSVTSCPSLCQTLGFCSPPPPPPSTPPAPPPPPPTGPSAPGNPGGSQCPGGWSPYTVKPGDTYRQILKDQCGGNPYNLPGDPDSVFPCPSGRDIDNLRPGETICIPC